MPRYSAATIHAGDSGGYGEILLGADILRLTGPHIVLGALHTITLSRLINTWEGHIHVPITQMRTLRCGKAKSSAKSPAGECRAGRTIREPSDASLPLPQLQHLHKPIQETQHRVTGHPDSDSRVRVARSKQGARGAD